jgi:RNA polymerase-binding transcription factor DksA
MVISLLDSSRARLEDLGRAGAAIDDGTYGRCIVCGEPIGAERLLALPTTRTCAGCAT